MSETREPYVLTEDARRAGYTPGPWRAAFAEGWPPHIVTRAEGEIVGVVGVGANPIAAAESEANARLMAAAPAMVDLLLRWSRRAGADSPGLGLETLDLLRSAGVLP